MKLRPYQDAAISKLRKNIAAGCARQILVAPTGSGKTVMASHIMSEASAKGSRCIFLAHRKELIDQASSKLDAFGIDHGVIKAGHKRVQPWSHVQVASVQTLVRRQHFEADIVIVDECHRSTSSTYQTILERFAKPPVVIGLTATPYRTSGRPLGDMYQAIVESTKAKELVEQGHLVNPVVYAASRLDRSTLKVKKNGEYTDESVAQAMEAVMVRGVIIDNWLDKCKGAATVVFAQNVAHSKEIVRQYVEAGIPAAHLDGKTPKLERERILADLASRKLQVVSNCGVLSEGYDLPLLECVTLARPLKSRGIWKQMIGRVMRPSPEKRMAVVMDHGANTQEHGFVTDDEIYTLEQEDLRRRGIHVDIDEIPTICPNCNAWIPHGESKCPACGFEHKKDFAEVQTVEDLVEVQSSTPPTIFEPHVSATATSTPSDEIRVLKKEVSKQQAAYNQWCESCVKNQYKPGWVAHRYKERFGRWPSRNIKKPYYFKQYEIKRQIEDRRAARGETNNENGTATRSQSSTGFSKNTWDGRDGWDI